MMRFKITAEGALLLLHFPLGRLLEIFCFSMSCMIDSRRLFPNLHLRLDRREPSEAGLQGVKN